MGVRTLTAAVLEAVDWTVKVPVVHKKNIKTQHFTVRLGQEWNSYAESLAKHNKTLITLSPP